MLKSCRYCGKVHDSKIECAMKPKKKKREYKEYEAPRYTKAMRDKSKEIKQRAKYLCEVCKLECRYIYLFRWFCRLAFVTTFTSSLIYFSLKLVFLLRLLEVFERSLY